MPQRRLVMARVHRFDRVEQRPPQKRADGSVRYDGVITRAGVFPYRQPDGTTRREYRPPEEVGRADSLESLELAHLVDGHPAKPGLAKGLKVGTVGDRIDFDGWYVKGACIVTDDATVAKVTRGDAVELSAGYAVDLDLTPGVSPQGESYDAVQRNIVYEHVAIVARGRAGSSVRLRTDDADGWRADAAVMIDPWIPEVRVTIHSASLSSNDLVASVRTAITSIDGVTLSEPPKYEGVKEDSVDAAVRPGSMWEGVPPGRASVQVCSSELGLTDLTAKLKAALAAVDVVVGSPDPSGAPASTPPRIDRADSAGHQEIHAMDEMKKKLDAALAESAAEKARADAAEKERDALKGQVAAEKARADKAEGERDTAKERADAADKARKDAVDAAPATIRARIKLEDTALRILGAEFKVDGLDDTAIRRAVVEKLTGKTVPADKSADYVAARFDSAVEAAGESVAAGDALRTAASEPGGTRADDDPRAQMIARQQQAGDRPLTPTRSN